MFGRSIIIGILLFVAPVTAVARERYFVVIFSSQRMPPHPDYAHTFAAFVKATETEKTNHLVFHTISWLPENRRVKCVKLWPEKGKNFGLHNTIRWAYKSGQRVSMWGPYEIQPEIYRRSIDQYKLLLSGQVQYKAIDSFRFDSRVSNCIHAVSTIPSFCRLRVGSPSFGETASWFVTMRYYRWMIAPNVRHEWVAKALQLDQYPIIRRGWEAPRTGFFWTTIKYRLGVAID